MALWNPVISGALQPGLSETKIRAELKRANVTGDTELVVEIYSWRNGVFLNDINFSRAGKGFFPGEPYCFLLLEMATGHFKHCITASRYHPELLEGAGRYFPIFWNGSDKWIGIDLYPEARNRVMLMRHSFTPPFQQLCDSFDAFLADVSLACQNKSLPGCLVGVGDGA